MWLHAYSDYNERTIYWTILFIQYEVLELTAATKVCLFSTDRNALEMIQVIRYMYYFIPVNA